MRPQCHASRECISRQANETQSAATQSPPTCQHSALLATLLHGNTCMLPANPISDKPSQQHQTSQTPSPTCQHSALLAMLLQIAASRGQQVGPSAVRDVNASAGRLKPTAAMAAT
jgi:hypothetical protein